jgi:hypothetical protein
MRKYYSIWKQLKETTLCAIAAPVPLHKRIIKAVKKEKDKDVGFKFMLSERGKRARLIIEQHQAKITFRLVYNIGVEDL